MKRNWGALLALTLTILLANTARADNGARHLVVAPNGEYPTIQAAVDAANDGDTIEVQPGTYRGPVVVTKSVTLEGVAYPVIDNGGEGTVVILAKPGIVLRGFELRGSGGDYDRDHSGIIVSAPRVVVENNRLREVLFGIFVSQASDVILRGNDVTSKDEFEIGRKGDAIRLWYSPNALVENNHVHDARDIVVWYSKGVTLRDNVMEHGRYGVHLMYCDDAVIERNQVTSNSVGIYAMYSNNVVMRENWIRGQRGPSGYALGFKDVENILVENNVLVDNRAGLYIDQMPFSPDGYGRIRNNIIAFNDVGVIVLPANRGAEITGNTFWENVEQVSIQGGGALGKNLWNGNYWSDYTGFDADNNGRGHSPYLAEHFFEGIADREPMLRMLLYSPAAQAIEFAASAFPIVRPIPKLTDAAPSMRPLPIPAIVSQSSQNVGGMFAAALGLLGVSLSIGALVGRGGNMKNSNLSLRAASRREISNPLVEMTAKQVVISVDRVTKRYGKVNALDAISFEAHAGEAIALWGPNGAGKTTLLKALLGLIDFQGTLKIQEHDVKRAGKLARRSIGYVPQETIFYDVTVQATLDFYARLKKVNGSRATELLERVGLSDHARKPVPALSGGLKQRLALAVALLADPPVLLLDEPTANLDAQARREYLALLASLHHEGKTILFASHRIEEVETLADRVLVIRDGKLAQVLTPEALRAQLAPSVEMTLWIDASQRTKAVAVLSQSGWNAHTNGRGTIVVQVPAAQKMNPLYQLTEQGVCIINFEMEEVAQWN